MAEVSKMLQQLFPDDALPEPSFCSLCAAITYEALNSSEGYQHVEHVADLNKSAGSCSLCHLIVLAIIESARHGLAGEHLLTLDDATAEFESRWRQNGETLPSVRPVVLRLKQGPPNILNIDTVFTSARARAADRHHARTHHAAYLILHGSGDIDQKPMTPRADLVQFLMRLRIGLWGWTANREELSPIPEVKLPDRVLDLSEFLITSDTIRLIATADIPSGSYATLSYCWGGYRGCITEIKSYNDRCQGFDVRDLPILFQQACFVTRLWGIKYLWIDALRIIQDSQEDWQKQASQMAEIYRNCAVRIAATSAKDPTCGIIPPGPVTPSIRVKQVEGPDRWFSHEGKCFVTLPKRYEKDVDLGVLNSRAWVVQERLLAPRTVHFCKDHIYFETERWGIVGEDMVSQFELRFTSVAKGGINRARMMQKRITSRNYDGEDDTSDSWQRIAELFSSCNITYPTDKLIALAGLIKDRREYGKFPYHGSKNYLGMWETTLHEDLLWVSTSSSEMTFLQDLNLPTWAWIAYEGPVQFVKDKGSIRERWTVQTSPICEFELLGVSGDNQGPALPLSETVRLSLKLKMAKIPAMGSQRLAKLSHYHGRDTCDPPFRHWPGTYNRPIPLGIYDDYATLSDANGELIGYVSMDTTEDLTGVDLWCAHIATLHDKTYRGPDPLSRYRYAVTVDRIAAITIMGVGPEYKETADTHILAYCLVVSRKGTTGNEFRRHGIAEVKYEWIQRAETKSISLV